MLKYLFIIAIYTFIYIPCTASTTLGKDGKNGHKNSVWAPHFLLKRNDWLNAIDTQTKGKLLTHLRYFSLKDYSKDYYKTRYAKRYERKLNTYQRRGYNPIIGFDGSKRSLHFLSKNQKGNKRTFILLHNGTKRYINMKIKTDISLLEFIALMPKDFIPDMGILNELGKLID